MSLRNQRLLLECCYLVSRKHETIVKVYARCYDTGGGEPLAECTVAFMMRCTSGRHMSYVGKISLSKRIA
jgi:hypothetical protein